MTAERHAQQADRHAEDKRHRRARPAASRPARAGPLPTVQRPPSPRPIRTNNSARTRRRTRRRDGTPMIPPNSLDLRRTRAMRMVLQYRVDQQTRPERQTQRQKCDASPGGAQDRDRPTCPPGTAPASVRKSQRGPRKDRRNPWRAGAPPDEMPAPCVEQPGSGEIEIRRQAEHDAVTRVAASATRRLRFEAAAAITGEPPQARCRPE